MELKSEQTDKLVNWTRMEQEKQDKDPRPWKTWACVVAVAEPCDLIEIRRYNGLYAHWGMYIGNAKIVHVTQVKDRTEGMWAELRVDTLRAIARTDPCRVNNMEEVAAAKGLTRRTNEQIMAPVAVVTEVKGKVEVVTYHAANENCEHYVTRWTYGLGFSKQVEDAFAGNVPPEKIHASLELLEDLERKYDN